MFAMLFFSEKKKKNHKKKKPVMPGHALWFTQTRMPLGCPTQDGDNNDYQEDSRGVKRGLKSLCEATLSSK